METPALVLSGHVAGLGVIRGLSEGHLPVYLFRFRDDDVAQASRHVVRSFRTRDPVEDERGFVADVLKHGGIFRGALLVPSSDEALAVVSQFKPELEEHFAVGCPAPETARICLDKARTALLADEAGLPAPRTVAPRTLDEAIAASLSLGFPILVKPTRSHLYYQAFGRKMTLVGDRPDLELRFAEATAAGLEVVLQELIPGSDDRVVNYNAYCRDGEVVVDFTARQLRKAPWRLGSPRVLISEWIPGVVAPGRAVLAALGYSGFANVEMKWDSRDRRYKLLEVNARHNMSSLLAVRCGVNFPLIEYRYRIRGEMPRPVRQRDGIYWLDNLKDVVYSLRGFRQEGLSLSTYVMPYARPHCDAILDRDDLGPFGARLSSLGRRACRVGIHAMKDAAAQRPRLG
jgi:D-aspartate ligase